MITSVVGGNKWDRIATGAVTIYRTFRDTDRVLLVQSLKSDYLVLPKGGLEDGLTPEDNAIKETREEAGIDISVGELVFDDVIQYKEFAGYRGKLQREIYFLGKFENVADEWVEADIREMFWWDINDPELEQRMTTIQYDIVRKAYDTFKGARK